MATPDILFIIAVFLNLLGLIGTIIPAMPGPPLCFAGMVLCCIAAPHPVMIVLTVLMFLLVAFVTVLDFVIPGWLTNKVGGCKKATWGATLGLLVGFFYAPLGLIIGPFLGAFLGEYTDCHKVEPSLKVACYTFFSLLIGTFFKLITCIAIFVICIGDSVWYYFFS